MKNQYDANDYIPLPEDMILKVVATLPDELRATLRTNPLFHRTVFIAGGFMTSVATNGFSDSRTDVDCWTTSDAVADRLCSELIKFHGDPDVVTDNAATFRLEPPFRSVDAIQVITANHFDCPQVLMANFDFSICAAAIWRDGEVWRGMAHKDWMADIINNRLRFVQTQFLFSDTAQRSLIRSYKWTKRGFEIDAFSLATIINMLPEYRSFKEALDHFDPSGNGGPITKLKSANS